MAHFWFAFDVGAYEDSTAHLSMLQDGAYNRLLRHYYKTAKPIPEESAQIIRICGAHSVDEIEAVTYILKSFFRLKSDGYHNIRADKELLKSKQLSKLRAISAKRRWDDKRHAKPMQLHNSTDAKADTVTVTVTTTEPKSKAKAATAQFTPPSIAEVEAHCRERGNGIDAEHFVSHYAARGWKYGGGVKMSDWKKAIITWEKRDGQNQRVGNGQNIQSKPRPTVAHTRFGSNIRVVGAAAGLGVSGGSSARTGSGGMANQTDSGRTGHEAGHSTGDDRVMEGEIVGLPR